MQHKGWLAVGALLLMMVIAWYACAPTQQADNPQPALQANIQGVEQPDLLQTTTATNTTSSFKTGLENLPQSLQGTDVDGEILIDENKNLHVTKRLRDLFDYFLSTLGEESLATIIERVKAYVQHRVPDPAKTQVLQLFEKYLAYRDALKQINEAGGKSLDQIDPDAIARQKAQEQRLRQQYFNAEEIQAFFGEEDTLDDFTLRSLRINQDKSLSDVEKARHLKVLSDQLPASVQQGMQSTLQSHQLQSLTEDWKKRGGSALELRQIRQELVGVEATERLEQLDQQRAGWQQRVNQYLAQRESILGNKNLSAAQQQQQITTLRQQGFDSAEQKRLPAFEQGFKASIP
jgi:lipase chaperone LimK